MLGKKKEEKNKELNILEEDLKEDKLPEVTGSDEWMEEYEGQLAIDVYQTGSEVVIKAPIAGVKPEDIDIAINDDVVTVKGERKQEKEIKQEDYYCQECYWGAFSRSVILPVGVAAEKAKASFKDGILTVTLPKASVAKSKKIKVRSV